MSNTYTFYFAWVEETETTFGPEHEVFDENVFAFSIEHREGDCATLDLKIRNPRIGLLAPGRKVWAWFSYKDDSTGSAVPLFFGRLTAVPENLFGNSCTLIFIAKSLDYVAQRRALAESLAVLPFYDPVFIDEDLRIFPQTTTQNAKGDIDAVLEGYSARFHVDRISHLVTISDICIGEDGTEVFESETGGPAGVAPESISLVLSGTPLSSITIKASVNWVQDTINAPAINLGTYNFETYMGNSLMSGWPKPGASIGGGWAAAQGTTIIDYANVEGDNNSEYNFNWHNRSKTHTTGDVMSVATNKSAPVVRGPYQSGLLYRTSIPGVVWGANYGDIQFSESLGAAPTQSSSNIDGNFQSDAIQGYEEDIASNADSDGDVINTPLHYEAAWCVVPQSVIQATLQITYQQGRKRTEHISFTMTSDVQEVSIPPDVPPDDSIVDITGADVGVPIGGETPIFDRESDSYFPTDRGLQSIEYLLLRGRAALLNGARLVDLSFGVPFDRAVNFSCRKNATLVWSKLPGGMATGKITSYTITGEDGKFGGTVTVSCTVGHGFADSTTATGGAYETIGGTPTYAEDGYVELGYQVYSGVQNTVTGNLVADVAYSPPVASLSQNSINLSKSDVVLSETTHGSVALQADLILSAINAAAVGIAGSIEQKQNATSNASALIQQNLKDQEVWLELSLKPVDDFNFADEYDLEIQPLLVPKTIDLEAASS